MIEGCEAGGRDMVWRDTVETIEEIVARGRMTKALFASLSQYLAIEIDETISPPVVRVARLPRPVAINVPASLRSGEVRRAIERGTAALNALVSLYEHGTDDDVATDAWGRGAAIQWDVMRSRALSQDALESGLGTRLMLLRAATHGRGSR